MRPPTRRRSSRPGERLIDRWMQPDRHFHNVRHLTDVLARVDELERETHEPQLVRLAAWYHGAIFDADEETSYAQRGGEDELASAALARAELTELGLPAPGPDRVAELVTALRRHAPRPEDVDCAVLCDADLAMLAGDPQRYKTYLAEVRAEYAHLPVEEFVRARIAILRKLDPARVAVPHAARRGVGGAGTPERRGRAAPAGEGARGPPGAAHGRPGRRRAGRGHAGCGPRRPRPGRPRARLRHDPGPPWRHGARHRTGPRGAARPALRPSRPQARSRPTAPPPRRSPGPPPLPRA